MATPTVTIPFEDTELTLELPRGWQVIAEHRPHQQPGLEDLAAAPERDLDAPIGCGALSSFGLADKKIGIAVDDFTRPTPIHRYFDVLLAYLERHGAQRQDLLVLPALGIHRDTTQEEMAHQLGKGNLQGLCWVNHSSTDVAQLQALGTTSRGTYPRVAH